jgi:hypothetical protein
MPLPHLSADRERADCCYESLALLRRARFWNDTGLLQPQVVTRWRVADVHSVRAALPLGLSAVLAHYHRVGPGQVEVRDLL